MRKLFLLVPISMLILIMNSQAQDNLPTITTPTRENLLEDAVIDLLESQMYSAVDKHYGTRRLIGFQCQKVIEIKKLDHSGSWLFEAKLEGRTFTGIHEPLDIFTITVRKDESTKYEWVLHDYKVRKFNPNEKYECRNPA